MNQPNHSHVLASWVARLFIDAGANDASSERQPREAFRIVVLAAILVIVPVALTLRTVVEPGRLEIDSRNPSPLGYTWSLLLFIVPVAPLSVWLAMRRDLTAARNAFWPTIATLLPLGFVLDLVFGNAFFSFPNGLATLGLEVPAVGGPIPIEEFIFYVTGFMLVLLSYIWADEYWLRAYQTHNYPSRARQLRRISCFHLPSVLLGAVLIGAAVLYKKTVSASPEGFPCYFIYLTLTSLVPCSGFLGTVLPFVNWRVWFYFWADPAAEPPVGGDPGYSKRVVAVRTRDDDGAEYRDMAQSAGGSRLRLVRREFYHDYSLRGDQDSPGSSGVLQGSESREVFQIFLLEEMTTYWPAGDVELITANHLKRKKP